MKREKLGAVIMGMHRSGTSLLTGIFSSLGFNPGKTIMIPQPDNPEGFWENQKVVDIHDSFFTSRKLSWDYVGDIPSHYFSEPCAAKYREELENIFCKDYSEEKRWVMKDPRICRLFPLWKNILKHSNHEIVYFLLFRNPEEVYKSLNKRAGFSRGKSYLLWLRHVIDSERYTRGSQRIFINFANFRNHPVEVINLLINRLDLKEKISEENIRNVVEDRYKEDLVHHRVESNVPCENSLIARVYEDLVNRAENERYAIEPKFDALVENIKDFDQLYSECFHDVFVSNQKTNVIKMISDQLSEQKTLFEAEFNEFKEIKNLVHRA